MANGFMEFGEYEKLYQAVVEYVRRALNFGKFGLEQFVQKMEVEFARLGFRDWIEVVASASVISNKSQWDWFNPGVGVTLTPFKTLQIYAFLDYISNIYLIEAKNVNLSLGINLLFGKSQHR